jgi:hypothetical protein
MSGSSAGQPVPEEPGTATQEATRLAEALHGWWAPDSSDRSPDPDHTGSGAASGTASGTCRHCPLCRGLAAAQAARPEVVEHLLTAAEALAGAWQELSRDRSAQPSAGSAQPSAGSAQPSAGSASGGRPAGSADPPSR